MIKLFFKALISTLLLSLSLSFKASEGLVDLNLNSKKALIDTIKIRKASVAVRIKRCVIWVPKNYCNYPKTAIFASSFEKANFELEYLDCKVANETDHICCIWLSILGTEKAKIILEDQIKNFSFVKEKDKDQRPFMIKISNESIWSTDFKGKKMTVNFSKQLDIFLFFKNVNAKPNDKFSINNLTTLITT
jgi:hypothetical protein